MQDSRTVVREAAVCGSTGSAAWGNSASAPAERTQGEDRAAQTAPLRAVPRGHLGPAQPAQLNAGLERKSSGRAPGPF